MAEWWINNSGQNLLKGIVDDETNPALLPDNMIASFFDEYPAAVTSYLRMRGALLSTEQERLDALLKMAQNIMTNPHDFADTLQATWNKAGIRTVGRYGGTRRGGNT